MYESDRGMGYSPAPGYVRATTPGACGAGASVYCVSNLPEDVAWRSMTRPDGRPQCQPVHMGIWGRSCRTTDRNEGQYYCCYDIAPSLSTAEQIAWAEEEGVPLTTRRCERDRVNRGLMRNESQRAIWDIQERLCSQGLDPGPVSGVVTRTLVDRVRGVQRERGITVNGQVDAVTAQAIGFGASEAQRIAAAVARSGIGTSPDEPPPLAFNPWLFAAAAAAAGFLGFAYYQYAKAR